MHAHIINTNELNGKRRKNNERVLLTPINGAIVFVKNPRNIIKDMLRPIETETCSSVVGSCNFKVLIRVIPGTNVRYKNPATCLTMGKSNITAATARHWRPTTRSTKSLLFKCVCFTDMFTDLCLLSSALLIQSSVRAMSVKPTIAILSILVRAFYSVGSAET
jgi:hypothetical protein